MRRNLLVIGVATSCAGLIAIGGWAYARMSEARKLDEGIVALKNGNYSQAVAVLTPLSDAGNRTARDSLGFLYALGLGVPRDRERAVALIRTSGSPDLPEMYFSIAREWEEGKIVARDDLEAKAWFELAAEAGHVQARARLVGSK